MTAIRKTIFMTFLLALVTAGLSTAAMAQYRTNDSAARTIVRRIQTRTDSLQRAVQNAADRNNYRVEDIERMILDFESAANQLDRRLSTRRSTATSAEVQALLDLGEQIDAFFSNNRLGAGSRREWQAIRTDLNQLAGHYNLRPEWSSGNNNGGGYGGGGYGNRRDLTGTFQLNQSRGDDIRRTVDNATRNLSLAERQRVYDSLLRRLDSPSMLAIERRGNSVTIVSTRAPQINFVADGREQVETTARGRSVRVRANFVGDTLTITRTGERANDFTVSFDPTGGRELLVTRTLYSDRLNQPVTVRSYYDRTSDVAQLNIYETNREDSNIGGTTTTATGTFIIPDGTQLVAVLNNDLSTQNVREGDRFTMTVRSPGQYDGATIEGSVLNVERSGRVTGRSEMTFDFDTIRLRDGRSYQFAGILESVRTPNGDVVRVDNEGAVRDSDQTKQTVTRTAIGTAVGAIIGAIAGGGKGAAIGAVVGAGAGAGSVYIQGRDDLQLSTGTEVTIRTTGPRG